MGKILAPYLHRRGRFELPAIEVDGKCQCGADEREEAADIADKIGVKSTNDPAAEYRGDGSRETLDRGRDAKRTTFPRWRSNLSDHACQRWP